MYILSGLFLAFSVAYFIFSLKRLNQAIFALPLFFPLYLWKVNFAGIPFTLSECFIYAALFAFLVGLFIRKKNREDLKFGWRTMKESKIIWLVLILVVAAAVGVFVSKDKIIMIDGVTPFYGQKIALGIFKGWIVAPLLMFIMTFAVVKKGADLLKMLNYYTVSALLLGLWGLFQVLSTSYVTPDARASGPFESANYLALYMAPAVLYLIIRVKEVIFPMDQLEKYSFWKIPFKRRKVPLEHPESFFFIFGFLIMGLVLLFTKSYAAMMAVAGAAIFYFGAEYAAYRRKKGRPIFTMKVFLLLMLILGGSILTVFIVDPSKLADVAQFESRNSSSVRVEVYTIATNLIKENWLTGIGLGQFPAYYQLESVRILGHVPYEWNMLHPHNLYLAFWLNTGLFGFVAFILLIVMMFKTTGDSLKSFAFRKVADAEKIHLIGLSLLMIILLHGIFDTPFFKNDLALIFWLIAAVIFLPKQEWKK